MIGKATKFALSFIAAIALSTGAVSAANATESDPVYEGSVEMTAIQLTAESAVAHGFAVQTDADGQQWAVALGTPAGDLSNAVLIPDVSARGIVYGNCGSAYLYLDSRTWMRTGYTIATPWGAPVSHAWSVSIHSPIDFESYDMGGLAPWGNQSWNGTRTIGTQALSGQTVNALAGRSVLTSNGGLCVSGSPTASRVW